MEGSEDENVAAQKEKHSKVSKMETKEIESGIIYLSRIPTLMTVKKVRQIFEQYGEIGRIFLQPDNKPQKGKTPKSFTEGWVEFMNKKIAKRVAMTLNNTQVGGKRRSPWYEEIWNIKYLPKFKWIHLNERLAYEQAIHKERMRTEITQVKKQTEFYKQNVERREKLDRLEKKKKLKGEIHKWEFKQKDTEDEILAKKERKFGNQKQGVKRKASHAENIETKKKPKLNKSFLKTLFSGGGQTSNDE